MVGRERIVDDQSIPEEYFCPICRSLLWKAHSCGRCQHLFCEECIHRWLTVENRCPFRCDPYEDRRCPPSMHSLLSHVKIHCENHSLGCEEICSYDQLEQHQTVQCQFRTDRILSGDLTLTKTNRLERYLSRWKKMTEFQPAQHQLVNAWSFFIVIFTLSGFSSVSLVLFKVYLNFIRWFKKHFFSGLILLIIFSSSLNLFVRETLIFVVSDVLLICPLVFVAFLLGCSMEMPWEQLQLHPLANQKSLSFFVSVLSLVSLKICFFSLRCLFNFLPLHLTTGLLVFSQLIFIQQRTTRVYRHVIHV